MPVTLGDKADISQFVFRKGESFTAVVYSNTAGTIRGNVRVVYDDGTEDDFKFNEASSGSSRAGVILTCAPHVTARPGVVVSMFLGVSGAITQRGMCFAQVWMTNDPQSSGAISLLAQGYIYIGSPLILGVYVEPGPASGHGNVRTISLGNPAAGAEYVTIGVPTGTLWKVRTFQGTLVAAAVAVNRKPVLSYDDGTNVFLRSSPGGVATTGQTVQFSGGIGQSPTDVNDTASLAGDTISWGLPDCVIVAGGDISFLTLNIQGTDDWGAGFLEIEEWVMPN